MSIVNVGLVALAIMCTAAMAQSGAKILVLGDSLAAGYGLPPANAFPVRLEAALRAEGLPIQVINAGVSGDTSAGGLARLDWALAERPDAVIVELGANDGLRGLDPKQTEANLDAILTRLRARGLRVLLTGMMAPPNFGRDYGRDFNGMFQRLAEKHGVPLYPFFLEGVAADPALNQADGIHPNAKGVEIIVGRLLPLVRKLVAAGS